MPRYEECDMHTGSEQGEDIISYSDFHGAWGVQATMSSEFIHTTVRTNGWVPIEP